MLSNAMIEYRLSSTGRAVPYKHAKKLSAVLHAMSSHFMTPNAETIAAAPVLLAPAGS
jgi:hypothetical protein